MGWTGKVSGFNPPRRCIHSWRHLGTHSIEANAAASTFDQHHNAEFDDDMAEIPFIRLLSEAQRAGCSCNKNSAGSGTSFSPCFPWRSQLCSTASLVEHFGTARRGYCGLHAIGGRSNQVAIAATRGTFPERLQVLWTTLQSDFKHMRERWAFYDLSPTDFVDATCACLHDKDDVLTSRSEGPDLALRIGIFVFFRLLGSLRRSKNTRGILKLIRQVPGMIDGTPALSLLPQPARLERPHGQGPTTEGQRVPPADLTAGVHPQGVVKAVVSAAEGLLSDGHQLTSDEEGEVLAATVGLAIKRGSLDTCLQVLKLLLSRSSMDGPFLLPGVGCHLKELRATQPFEQVCGDARGADMLSSSDDEDDEAGVLLSLKHRWGCTAEAARKDHSGGSGPIPAILQTAELTKVNSTVLYQVAITADGELLVWRRSDELTKEDSRSIAEAGTPPPLLGGPGGVRVWKPGMQRDPSLDSVISGCVCTSFCPPASSLTGGGAVCRVERDGDSLVLQILADKPAVVDIACGLGHTLALLITGQVLSWGIGANGRLGLSDTRDRVVASLVDGLQGIDIKGVSCGASHSLAISVTGAAYAWGKNSSGQCGYAGSPLPDQVGVGDILLADPSSLQSTLRVVVKLSPRVIEGLTAFPVVSMAGGWEHTLALTRCGQVFSFGAGHKDERTGDIAPVLGISSAAVASVTERGRENGALVFEIGLGSKRAKTIASGWDHCMVVTSDGSLFTWGAGGGGQLGHGDTEPRHLPARVDFFATPAGGRICSAVGGQSHTAVVTSDGRLFIWGSKRRHKSQRASGGEGGSDVDDDDKHATEAVVACPQLIDEIDGNDHRAIGIGMGHKFDLVLTAPRPTQEKSSASTGSCQVSDRFLKRGWYAIPDDSSQPVGRVEVAMLMLQQLERLACPHMPIDPVAEVERKVFRALADRFRSASSANPSGPAFPVAGATANYISASDGHTTTHADRQNLVEKAAATHREDRLTSPRTTAECAQGNSNPGPEALSNAFSTSATSIPFCVETSPEVFQYFLDLLRDILMVSTLARDTTADELPRSSAGLPVRAPGHAFKVNPRASFKAKHTGKYLTVVGREVEVGPESSPYAKYLPEVDPAAEALKSDPNDARCSSETSHGGLEAATPEVQREVLRCTLKLLRINLFYLARAAGVRRVYCGIYGTGKTSAPIDRTTLADWTVSPSAAGDLKGGAEGTAKRGVDRNSPSRDEEPAFAENTKGRPEAWTPPSSRFFGGPNVSRAARSAILADGGIGGMLPELQEATLGSLGDGEPQSRQKRAATMRTIVDELHSVLWRILEGEMEEEAAAGKINTVLAEAAEAFRVGFSIFYPCNSARIRLLRDMIGSISCTGSGTPCTPLKAQDDKDSERTSPRCDSDRNRSRLTRKSNRVLVQAASEGLARDTYAAAVVADALRAESDRQKKRAEGGSREGAAAECTMERLFDATELESAMRSLLVYCVSDLIGQLRKSKHVPRPETTSCSGSGDNAGEDANGGTVVGCPYVHLLLALQAHVMGSCSDAAGRTSVCAETGREVAVAHAVRVLEASLEIFTRFVGAGQAKDGGTSDEHSCSIDSINLNAMRHSFLALLPLLCTCLVALPVPTRGRMSVVAAVLPSLLALVGAVDRFNRLQEAKAEASLGSSSGRDVTEVTRWVTGLEEALATLSADLVCSLTEEGAISPYATQAPSSCRVSEQRRGDCNFDDHSDSADHDHVSDGNRDTAELLLLSSPFLEPGRDCFDWPSGDFGSTSLRDDTSFADARKVINWAERIGVERLSSSRATFMQAEGSGPASGDPPGRPLVQHNFPHKRRRASGDRSEKLSPIGPNASVTTNSSQVSLSDAHTRCSDSVGSLGDESTGSGLQGSVGSERAGCARTTLAGGNCSRNGSVTAVRQLDSMVDETRAEGFIQDLLCGQGAAQKLYQWMAAPPEPQHPVLHATSLATQMHGCGSYQSLSSHAASTSGSQCQYKVVAPRRRQFSALASDVDAAARALVGVIIKSNGLVTEAATFARFRLDRASSPPPRLKLVAAAAAEVRDVLTGLADSSGGVNGTANSATAKAHGFAGGTTGEGYDKADTTRRQSAAATTLSAIVRNCNFLLKCRQLPTVSLARAHRQQRSADSHGQRAESRHPRKDRGAGRAVSDILRGWADDARTNVGFTQQRQHSLSQQKSPNSLAVVCEQMAQGRVQDALLAAEAAEKEALLSGCTGLESLMAFAASPVVLDVLELRAIEHELLARVCATGFRLVRYLLEDLQISVARRQVSTRLARALRNSAGDDINRSPSAADRPAIFSGIRGAGRMATTSVHSAFVELCSYAVCELRHGRAMLESRCVETSTSPAMLALLRMLVEKIRPALVEHTVEAIGSQQPPGPGLAELKSTPSSCNSEKLAIVSGATWLGRLGGNISNSVGKADIDAVPPRPLPEMGVISVMAAALPQLGAMLSDEGDILTRDLWGPGASVGQCAIHRAAWRALCVLSTQVCSAPMWMRYSGKNLGHVIPSSIGRSASNSTDKTKYTSTGGVWWRTIQALLTVLFSELARVHERLKVLVENQEVEERLMVTTQATRLMVGSRLVPLPKMSALPHSLEDERSEEFTVTFWIWIPDFPPRNPKNTCEEGLTRKYSLGRTDVSTAFSRAAIYAPVDETVPVGGSPGDGLERHPEVALVRFPPPKEHRALPGRRDDGDRVSIEFTILERGTGVTSLSSGAVKCIGNDRRYGTPAAASTMAVEAGGEAPPHSFVLRASENYITPCPVVERLISECPLPMGRWTHVCCSYSVSGESVDSTCGAREETSRSRVPIAFIAFDGCVVANRALPAFPVDGKAKRRHCTQQNQTHGEHRIGREGGSSEACMESSSLTGSSSPNKWQTSPAVCDLLWHQRAMSIEQAHEMASNGIPRQREKKQLAAECYVNRLATLAHEIAVSSQIVAAELSSSRWLALWLAIIPVVRFQAQRASLRLLRPLLCISERPEGVHEDSPPAVAPVGFCSPEYELTDRGVIDHLCSLLGGHLLPPRDDKCGYHFSGKRHERDGIVIDHLNESGEKLTPIRRCTTGMKLCHASSTVSDIVLLLRVLIWETPTRWRTHIDAAMTAGLVAAGTGALRTLSGASTTTDCSEKSLSQTESKHSGRSSVWLGATVAAAYFGGGHIEGPRVGGRVTVLPHCHPPVELTTAGAVPGSEETVQREMATREGCPNVRTTTDVAPIGEETCAYYGTVLKLEVDEDSCDQPSVDEPNMLVVAIDGHCWNCVDQIFEEASVVHQSSKCPSLKKDARSAAASTRIATVPVRQVLWEAEIPEPMATFLLNGVSLPAVQNLLESATVRNPNADMVIGQTGVHRGAGMGPSWESVVEAHIRCRLARALSVQFRHSEQAATALRGTILDTLLTLSSAPLPSATILALGLDGAVAFGQRRDFAAVVLCLDHQRRASSPHSLMADLQKACQAAWTRMSAGGNTPKLHRPRDRMDARGTRAHVERFGGDMNISSSPRPILQVLGGEALVEGNRVTASSHFPTIRLSDVNAGSRSAGGRWYYEVTLLTGGLMQLGWASSSFQCSPTRGQGVGDHLHSWAFDGFRQKRWCVSSASYGKRWRAGDVVGVLLDVGLQEMRFSLNGHDLGVAFVGFNPQGLYPAASMNVGQAARFNFGYSPFLYTRVDGDEVPFRPIAAATIDMATSSESDVDMCFSPRGSCPNLKPEWPVEPSLTEHRAPGLVRSEAEAEGRRCVGFSARESRDELSRGAELETGDGIASPRGDGTSCEDTWESDGDEGVVAQHLELQRQRLVENLMRMGFPVEWAIRAAERSADAVMSKSAATAWIIERLEVENTKMEEEMGNMDTCQDDFDGAISGDREAYSGETKVGDDSGFLCDGEAGNMAGSRQREARGINDDPGDYGWREMYSTVRRSSLARSNGESPVTASSHTAGRRDEGTNATPNDAPADATLVDTDVKACPRVSPVSAPNGSSATNRLQTEASRGLLTAVLSSHEEDLPCLSLVLETALSILFARAAVVNLLSHIRVGLTPVNTWGPRPAIHHICHRPDYAVPWSWVSKRRQKGNGGLINSGIPQDLSQPEDDREGGDTVAKGHEAEVVRRLVGALTDPGRCFHRRFLNLTKVLIHLPSGPRLLPAGVDRRLPNHSPAMTAEINKGALAAWDETLEDSPNAHALQYESAADPIRLFRGSYAVGMSFLFQLAASPAQKCAEWVRSFEELTVVKSSVDDGLPSGVRPEAAWRALLALPSFLALAIDEAVEYFEHKLQAESGGSMGVHAASSIGGKRKREQPSTRPNDLWAMWVVATVMTISDMHHRTYRSCVVGEAETVSSASGTRPSTGTGTRAVAVSDEGHMSSLVSALNSARSARTFTAVFLSASSRRLDFNLRCLGYLLCAEMINRSLSDVQMSSLRSKSPSEAGEKVGEATTTKKGAFHHTVAQPSIQDELPSPFRERDLARDFSLQLRHEISTTRLPSPLLQSQLELLAQWQRRKPTTDGETGRNGIGDAWETTEPCSSDGSQFPLDTSACASCAQAQSWDVATPIVAGPGGGGDGFEGAQTGNTRVERSRRPSTAESEGSALSNMRESSAETNIPAVRSIPVLMEAATATSVTLSWGGWVEDDRGSDSLAGADGYESMHTVCSGQGGRASTLAQALQAKARYTDESRREHASSLVLKVAAVGLWGSEPFKIAAVDLKPRDSYTVHGLAADTLYRFHLEQRRVPGDTPGGLTSEGGEKSDDERSCFAAVSGGNGNGGSSAGGSSADSPEIDTADGASSTLTGPRQSHGGGGSSAFSEVGTDVQTDERRAHGKASCASSARAAAGHNHGHSLSEMEAYTMDGACWTWHSTDGHKHPFGKSENILAVGGGECVIVGTECVATPPEVPFMLDTEGCGPNLRLSNSNLTVTNSGRKKWSTVRATVGFNSGVHRWKVLIDRCVSKNVFIGVVSSESILNNYIGSDRLGWGYLANKAIWHNKGKVRSYGELFREGDTIGVHLNMDQGTLRFARNGRDLGAAVQGLKGTLFPAFSMYNRSDQLTLVPPEAHSDTTPILPLVARGEGVGESPARCPSRVEGAREASVALHGTFSAECVIRRAARSLVVLGLIADYSDFESPDGKRVVESVRSCLKNQAGGRYGRLLPSPHAGAPVRLDTSERVRSRFFGLGTGDRVVSVEGEATVLGATRHSLWVSLEAPSPSSTSRKARVPERTRPWGAEIDDDGQDNHDRGVRRRHSFNLTAGISATRKSKPIPWSRRTVRHITGRSEEYEITRSGTFVTLQLSPSKTTVVSRNGGVDGDRCEHGGMVAAEPEVPSTAELQGMLSRWTPSMDEELRGRLERLADSLALDTPLDIPFTVLGNVPASTNTLALTGHISSVDVRARAALLLQVNDLVVPLLPLLKASTGNLGPLASLVRKCRHLLFSDAKLSFLHTSAGLTKQAPPLESAQESPAGYTVCLQGVQSLPTTAGEGSDCGGGVVGQCNPLDDSSGGLSWEQRSSAVEKSVFGQLAKQLSRRQRAADGPMAFSVQLTDTPAENDIASCDQMSDAYRLYRGVYWQACRDVFSPPISMFHALPVRVTKKARAASLDGSDRDRTTVEASRKGTICSLDDGVVPDPFFTSNQHCPAVRLDPIRLGYYRSFGFIAGLAVRTGVPLPVPRIAPRWWMLVAEEESIPRDASVVSRVAALGGIVAADDTVKTPGEKSQRPSEWERVSSNPPTEGTLAASTIDVVLAVLDQPGEVNTMSRESLDKILADAKFVGPLSNGQVKELLPGGAERPVRANNLEEFCARLAWSRDAEYAPQAAAFRAGLEAVLPCHVLSLLTWREMEALICGYGDKT